jgi:hypothetical protein
MLTGCASMMPEYKKVALIHVGMSRREVINSLGNPLKIVRNGSQEVLSYELNDTKPNIFVPSEKSGRYIVICRGRVESFGKE